MSAKKALPPFKDETEEAKWYDEHQDELEEYFEPVSSKAEAERIGLGFIPEKAVAKNITIRLPVLDIDSAKSIATKKGIGYQTLIKMIVHEWLENEKNRAS